MRVLEILGALALAVGLVLSPLSAFSQSPQLLQPWKRPLVAARDAQDTATLQQIAAASSPSTRAAGPPVRSEQLRALAYSFLSEVYLEQGKKPEAASAAKAGIALARQALESRPDDAELHCLLGTLCGQVIPASPLSAFSFGRCALEEVEQALRLNPNLPDAHLARGVGNYYLPPAFGGGIEKAETDFRKALDLAPDWPDVHLWLGLAARRRGDHSQALQHLKSAQRLAPSRAWIQTQIAKTPTPAPQ